MSDTKTTSLVLVTALPAAGKSATGESLKLRGYSVIDNDHSDFQKWGKYRAIKRAASLTWMLRNPSRWEDDLRKYEKEGETTIIAGWYPLVLSKFQQFDKIFYLSPGFNLSILVDRMRNRSEKTFGETETQIATALIAAIPTEIVMRVVALFKKNVKIINISSKTPEQIATTISNELEKSGRA